MNPYRDVILGDDNGGYEPVTQKSLYEKYQRDLAELQSKCTHEKQSDWMTEEWAPAHGTGFMVRQCEICCIIVDRKSKYPEFKFTQTIIGV